MANPAEPTTQRSNHPTTLFAVAEVYQAQRDAYRSVNILLIKRNWLLGKRIAEEELGGDERAEILGLLKDVLIPTRPIGITWSHYRKLLQVEIPDARAPVPPVPTYRRVPSLHFDDRAGTCISGICLIHSTL